MLSTLGAHAVTAVVVEQAPTRAPQQDFATLLAKAELSKLGIADPTPAELRVAVQSIQAQRTSGMGWGDIAHARGLKLGPVVSAANRAKHADDPKRTEVAANRSSRSTSRTEASANRERAERSDSRGNKGSNSQGGDRGGNGNGNGNGNGKGGGNAGNGGSGGGGKGGGKK